MGRLTVAFLAALAMRAAGQTGANCEESDLDERFLVRGKSFLSKAEIWWRAPPTQFPRFTLTHMWRDRARKAGV